MDTNSVNYKFPHINNLGLQFILAFIVPCLSLFFQNHFQRIHSAILCNMQHYLYHKQALILVFLSNRHTSIPLEEMSDDKENALWQSKLLQPPPRRTVNPNEASSSAGAAAGTNWRSTAGQNLRRQSGYFGDQQRGRSGPHQNYRHQQHLNLEPLQRRPNSNNYGSRRPYTPLTPFSELLLEIQHEEANKVINSSIICNF
jgi:hypothetical protein